MKQFNQPNSTVGPPTKSANEAMQADISPPSEMEVIWEMDFLKNIMPLDQMGCHGSFSRMVAKC